MNSIHLFAQDDLLTQARVYTDQKEYKKALEFYQKLYNHNPTDEAIYKEYLNDLIADKDFKDAQKLVENQQKLQPQNPLLLVDIGRVYIASGKSKKAKEPFEQAIQLLNGDDMLTTKMANAFIDIGQDQYAIQTYERATQLLRNNFIYGTPLARLYAKTGDIENAMNALLNIGPMQIPGIIDTKTTMLEILGNDPKKLQIAQKALVKRVNEQPENSWYGELLTWIYTQKDDWDGALIQITAIDERNKENGQRLLEFARTAKQAKQYDIAIKALDAIVELGKEQTLYTVANAEKMNVQMLQLENNPSYTAEDVTKLSKAYEQFFTDFPQYYNTETIRDYAKLEAQYNNNPEKAISLLKKALEDQNARKEFIGLVKLQLGDYYLLTGKIWDASLLYSQVDKAFKEDQLGEEARFKNAKLAYYRGDFDWAQGQLSVLKASTSELIANDALYLSVLITENIPPDSNLVPLRRFAYADLLLFQNKDKDAEALLDSISQAFPDHPLNDDILMLRAKLAIKHRDYQKALDDLKKVYDQYGKDVNGDDAVFQTAQIYELYLKQPAAAKKFYERLIVDYPGSTFVQTARAKLVTLQDVNVVP